MVYKFEHGTIEHNGTSDGYIYYILDGRTEKRAKLYYREFKTRFAHAGQYFIARFANGVTKRIYLCDMVKYR